MTKRPAPRHYRLVKQPGFTTGNLTNLFVIPILSGIFAFGGFYYLTNAVLTRHGDDIAQIKTDIKQGNTEDAAAKAKIRDDFLAAQMKTSDGIAKLDTRLAVAETNQKAANDTLTKIADTLQRITTVSTGTSATMRGSR